MKELEQWQLVGEYTGVVREHKPEMELGSRFVMGLPMLNGNLELDIDAEFYGNETRFINDYHAVKDEPNVMFVPYRRLSAGEPAMGVVTTRVVSAGEELLVDYGTESFWQKFEQDARLNGARFDVYVKMLNSSTLTVSMLASETVRVLKMKVQEKCAHTPQDGAQQRLVFSGKELNDTDTLADAGVHKGSTIHLLPPASCAGAGGSSD